MSKLKASFFISLSSYLLLLVCVVSNWVMSQNTWVILVIKLLPLLIFIPGLMRANYRTFNWLCFVVLLYFVGSVMSVMGPFGTIVDWLQLLATCSLFVSAMLFSRWRQQQLAAR